MSNPDTAALRALPRLATPLPWEGYEDWPDGTLQPEFEVCGPLVEHGREPIAEFTNGETRNRANMAFVVAAVNALPDILDRLDAAERLNRSMIEASPGMPAKIELQFQIRGLRASLAETESDLETSRERSQHMKDLLAAADDRVRELEQVLSEIAEEQPKVLESFRRNGIVFDAIGNDPKNWQHVAFTIYTDLCEIDTLARAALQPNDGSRS